jgi:diphosphate--fructose-6-phosphate 1-phosphotransferase
MVPHSKSALEAAREAFQPQVPELLLGRVTAVKGPPTTCVANQDLIQARFKGLYGSPIIDLKPAAAQGIPSKRPALKVGCVLSGGQASGGHNCIVGLYDYVTKHFPGSQVYGFLGGPKGVMTNSYKLLDDATIDAHRNSGGFTMLASGRDKIETPEQFDKATHTAKANELDGLVVIGGDDSNTNACLLAEHYKGAGLKCNVVGLPKTIDGDLKNEHCETSFGFDTAAKLYAELVGNIMVDCSSTQKYYHFIRLMGREASHLTLEVALLTQPNLAFIGEEIKAKGLTLSQVTNQICDLIVDRSNKGLDFGVVLVPEGLIEFIPEVGALMHELNDLLASHDTDSNSYEGLTEDSLEEQLTPSSRNVFNLLPDAIRAQLLLDRDPHGNVQVAKIESERLLGALVEAELTTRKATGGYGGKLALQYHYFGYEGRCPPPSAFDSNYCYGLGLTAGALISEGCTGVMACLQGLTQPPSHWTAKGVPLTCMLAMERRKGKDKPVIRKALVELGGAPFKAFASRRGAWGLRTSYSSPGPVQYDGPCALATTMTLRLEQGGDAPEALVAPLTAQRLSCPPEQPALFADPSVGIRVVKGAFASAATDELFVQSALPHTYNRPVLELVSDAAKPSAGSPGSPVIIKPTMSLGVVFCGRQCPGAHNVVAGLSAFLAARAGPGAKLWGFKNGTAGLFKGDAQRLTPADVARFLNTGGMQMLGRSADVIRSAEQFAQAEAACAKLSLDGLILVGGPVTGSDTAMLAEYFESKGVRTRVLGVPATIDGDLYSNSGLEASIGFDTACRVYASLVGNLAKDAASACKYWYFVRMMGRSPSHITLECANLTQPNVALIGEEIEAKRMTLAEVVAELADVVELRAREGKHFGVCLIPEGLIEYIPQVNALLKEIETARRVKLPGLKPSNRPGTPTTTKVGALVEAIESALSPWSKALLDSMPAFIRRQLLLETQASDHKAQLNQIETERLLADLVRIELNRRRSESQMTAEWCAPDPKFQPVCFYLGYQARSSMPSQFDANLAFALGQAAATLAASGATAYMATAHCLVAPAAAWRITGVPLYSMMSADRRGGAAVPIIRPSQVDLHSASFRRFALIRERLAVAELYCNPGPMQLCGSLAEGPSPGRLLAEHSGRAQELQEIEDALTAVRAACWAGCSSDVLKTALAGLHALRTTMDVFHERDVSRATAPGGGHASVAVLQAEQVRMRDN